MEFLIQPFISIIIPAKFFKLHHECKSCLYHFISCIGFCLIFNVQFYVFFGDEGRDSRLIQILKTFNLEDRAILRINHMNL